MCHSVSTADKSYNYSEISDSVAKVLALERSQRTRDDQSATTPMTSTPVKARSRASNGNKATADDTRISLVCYPKTQNAINSLN